MPESEISEQLAEAIVNYGLTDAATWHIDAGRITTNVGPPPQGEGARPTYATGPTPTT